VNLAIYKQNYLLCLLGKRLTDL